MSDVAAYHVFVCALFPMQGVMWTAVNVPPCTGINARTNTCYAATTLIIIEYS